MKRHEIQGKKFEDPTKFTLEDTYEHLKDVREEITREMEKLMHSYSNNETSTISQDLAQEEIFARCLKLLHGLFTSYSSLSKNSALPIPNSEDLYKKMIPEIEQVLDEMQQLLIKTESNIAETNKHCSNLRRDIDGLIMMKDGCLRGIKNVDSETSDIEIAASIRLFQECKDDLFTVVDVIFPNDDRSKNVLAALTKAYTKGGDDTYIHIEPETVQFVNFLIEANIATFHRNDKSRIKLTELL